MAKAKIILRNGKAIQCTGEGKSLDNEKIFSDLAQQGIPKSAVRKIVHQIDK